METIAVIPARGGSKGIPLKNIVPVAGKPLICHMIESALAANLIDRVVVSTDDSKIANTALGAGAEVIKRPESISGDTASSETALLHVLDTLKEREGYVPDILVMLQCTSPLTLPEDIDGTIKTLLDNDADTALAVAPFHYFLWKRDVNGYGEGINHDKSYRPMRQQRKNQYIENGAIYVIRAKEFFIKKHRFFGKTVMFEMPEERCFEIDEPVDLIIAEQLLLNQKNSEKRQPSL